MSNSIFFAINNDSWYEKMEMMGSSEPVAPLDKAIAEVKDY